jgi:membrane protease YdiL (CAAX protease family)
MMSFLKKYQIIIFFILTLIISWYPWYTGSYGFKAAGPSYAGLIVVLAVSGWKGIVEMLRRLVRWRVDVAWWGAAIFIPPALTFIAVGIHVLTGGEAPSFLMWKQEPQSVLFLMLILISPMGGAGGEEPFGWRGYSQPVLLKKWGKWGPLATSALIGIAWGIWHLPEFYNPASTQYAAGIGFILPMTVMWIANSIFMTWLYNKTGGSVLLSGVIYHLTLDLSSVTFLTNATLDGMTEGIPSLDMRLLTMQIIVFALSALLLLVVTRGQLGYSAPDEAVT